MYTFKVQQLIKLSVKIQSQCHITLPKNHILSVLKTAQWHHFTKVKQTYTNTTILNILSQVKYLQYDKIPIYVNMDIHYITMFNHCLLYTFRVKFYILLWLYILIKSYVNQLWSWKIKGQDLDLPYTFISSAFKLRLNH